MICPKCHSEMDAVEYEGIEVDRCRSCHGIWFDAGESHWLRHEEAASAIDTGDPAMGREHNETKSYRCPRCDGGMMRHVDLEKTRKRGDHHELHRPEDIEHAPVTCLFEHMQHSQGGTSHPRNEPEG